MKDELDYEVLSAFVDGEEIDLTRLEMALESARGRQILIDCVRLRQTARGGQEVPSAAFYERARKQFGSRPRIVRNAVPLPIAVAAMFVAAVVGSLFGTTFRTDQRQLSIPPTAARVLTFEPGIDWQSQP